MMMAMMTSEPNMISHHYHNYDDADDDGGGGGGKDNYGNENIRKMRVVLPRNGAATRGLLESYR